MLSEFGALACGQRECSVIGNLIVLLNPWVPHASAHRMRTSHQLSSVHPTCPIWFILFPLGSSFDSVMLCPFAGDLTCHLPRNFLEYRHVLTLDITWNSCSSQNEHLYVFSCLGWAVYWSKNNVSSCWAVSCSRGAPHRHAFVHHPSTTWVESQGVCNASPTEAWPCYCVVVCTHAIWAYAANVSPM